LRAIISGSSRSWISPAPLPSDFDIFVSGFCRSMTRAPTLGVTAFGTMNVSPKR
jgi:hypothetical protein